MSTIGNSINLLSTKCFKNFQNLPLNSGDVHAVSISKDAEIYAFTTSNGNLTIVNRQSNQIIKSCIQKQLITAIEVSNTSQYIAYASSDGRLHIYDLETDEIKLNISAEQKLKSFSWSLDDTYISLRSKTDLL